MTLTGYDIAGVNGSGIITTALTGAFTIVKASEGQTFTDPSHDSFVSQLRAKGRLVGHYHYGRPDTKGVNDAVKEADHFVTVAKAVKGDTMWLDFEKSETADQRVDWPEWVIAFCDRVKVRTGASCGVYWSDWFINRVLENATAAQAAKIRTYPLWKAGNNNAYVSDPSAGYGSIHGWDTLTCWQWTDKQGSLGIDRNIFYGDPAAWRALGVGAPSTPTLEEELMALTVKNPLTGDQWSTEDALWSIWSYAIQGAKDAGSALEIVKTLAASDSTQLTEEEIQAAAQKGAQAAIDAEIASATVNLNVTQVPPA